MGLGIWNTSVGIQNPTNDWNPESWALESGKHLWESGILLTIEIRNPSFPEKDLGPSNWIPESMA